MNKVMIYPVAHDSLALCIYLEKFCPLYKISSLISPQGIGVNGKDLSYIDNREMLNLTVSESESDSLQECDLIIIPTFEKDNCILQEISKIFLQADDNGKKIICATTIGKEIKSKFNNITYLDNKSNFEREEIKPNFFTSLSLQEPSIPIIFVGELIPNIGGYETLLSIANEYRQAGLNPYVLAEKAESKIMGLDVLPSFLFSRYVDFNDKIMRFNHYIQYIEICKKPDVILIQLPGGLMKYNEQLTNDFGFYAYLISQAVQPDGFICCSYYQNLSAEYMEQMNQMFIYRFGFSISCFNLTNHLINVSESIERKKFYLTHLSTTIINEYIETNSNGSSIPIFNLQKAQHLKTLITNVLLN